MPDLTLRDEHRQSAQSAAEALEAALRRWRGDATVNTVASYVAHSIDHPWGRPRVVVGLDVDDALALAAILTAQPHHDEPDARGTGATCTERDGADWHERAGAQEAVLALRTEVTEITSYGQEADQDLQADLAGIDIDNVQIALSSIHAAAERAIAQLNELHQP